MSEQVKQYWRARLSAVLSAAAVTALLWMPAAGWAASQPVDINSASVEQLVELPGIGPAKAAAIVEERGKTPFSSVDDLARVSGIGPGLIADLRDRLSVSTGGGE